MKAIQRLIASGMTYSQIAKELGITPHAVRFWANGARSPGHTNRQKLIALAESRGILLLGSDFAKRED